jgi:Gluconate 2-dehydrogenase subunit 3
MNESSRRAFLSRFLAGTGAAMAFGALPDFSLAHKHAAVQLHAGENKFAFFTPDEARQMEAVCEQIIPSDDGPGAREAGAIYFIDYALSQTELDLQPVFRAGLKELGWRVFRPAKTLAAAKSQGCDSLRQWGGDAEVAADVQIRAVPGRSGKFERSRR